MTYLRACRKAPSNVTWRGVGIACYKVSIYNQQMHMLSAINLCVA